MDERAQNGQKIQKFENQRSDMDGVCGFRVLVPREYIIILTKWEHARCHMGNTPGSICRPVFHIRMLALLCTTTVLASTTLASTTVIAISMHV